MLTIDLPKEAEKFVIDEANRENISHSEVIQIALSHLALERRIQNYKNDIELIRQGKMRLLSADEVFNNVRKRIEKCK